MWGHGSFHAAANAAANLWFQQPYFLIQASSVLKLIQVHFVGILGL
jgi:hypothetical protein